MLIVSWNKAHDDSKFPLRCRGELRCGARKRLKHRRKGSGRPRKSIG